MTQEQSKSNLDAPSSDAQAALAIGSVPRPNENGLIDAPQDSIYHTQEIEYLYLDFDTELPTPYGRSDIKEGSRSPPPCPNLKKYTSPFLWSSTRKSLTTWLACGVTLLASYSAGEYTPAASQLLSEWHVSQVAYNVGLTTFTVGFGIAPMVLAPFSEINGRRPVFIASGILFTACVFACGGANNLAGTLVARFFKGVGGCMSNVCPLFIVTY